MMPYYAGYDRPYDGFTREEWEKRFRETCEDAVERERTWTREDERDALRRWYVSECREGLG